MSLLNLGFMMTPQNYLYLFKISMKIILYSLKEKQC